MKKSFVFGAAILCSLGVVGSVAAVEMTGDSQDVTAEYVIGSSYSVTIPANIVFTSTQTSVTDTVGINNVLVDGDDAVLITMESANGNLVNGDSYVPYSYAIDGSTTQIEKEVEYTILGATNGTTSVSKEITFTAGELSHVSAAGRHADTLTFTVSAGSAEDIPESSNILVANADFIVGCFYHSGSLENSGAPFNKLKTHMSFIEPQKIRVVITDPVSDVSTHHYKVVYSAWDASGTILNKDGASSGAMFDLTNGVVELDLAALYPSAAKFKIDVLDFVKPSSFYDIPSTANINIYKVTD